MDYENPLFLIDGGQPAQVMADVLTSFIAGAKASLHIAIYDFRLEDELIAKQVVKALVDRANAGVDVRIAYDHRNAPKFGLGDDPAPHGTHAFLTKHLSKTRVGLRPIGLSGAAGQDPMPPEWNRVSTEPIAGSKLMHSKYVIRDGGTPSATVFMGSTNFTDDAWARQENNVLLLPSQALCAYYETDFGELWSSGEISGTGAGDFGTVSQDGLEVGVAFSPGEGKRIDAEIAGLISGAKESIHIASMVITSDAILSALAKVLEEGRVPVRGIYDGSEMKASVDQMKKSGRSTAKLQQIEALEKVLVAKPSSPYSPGGIHNFMHNKLLVADEKVLTGSHNFSLSAQENAENAILAMDSGLAAKYRAYVERLVSKYGK